MVVENPPPAEPNSGRPVAPDAVSSQEFTDASAPVVPQYAAAEADGRDATDERDATDGRDATDEPEWWDDPALPWKQKPTKSDIWCMSLIGIVGIYALVMLPLRPVMLTWAPQVLAVIGSRTGLVMTGALAAVGDKWWLVVWAVATVSNIKFDWIYWWAGHLWGHNIIEIWSGKSERARRRNDRAVRFAQKYETIALMLTFLPIPIPAGVVFAALGAAGTKLPKFLTVILLSSAATTAGYMYLGYSIGEPAVELMRVYGDWMMWLSIAILVGMLVTWWWKEQQKKRNA